VETQTVDGPGLRFGTAHAEVPERAAELAKMVRDLRPQATIELETTLGAVIGAHSGPGTVGFFWFDDE
jgi:fatty acid-binding protein DegV